MDREYLIGVEVTYFKIEAGLVDLNGKVIKKILLPTEAKKGKQKVIENIVVAITKMRKERILGVGICFPGQVESKKGIILHSPIQGMNESNLKRVIEDKVNLPVSLDNSANCLALAEYKIGFNKRFTTILTMIADAGITTGFLFQGKLYKVNDISPEVAHMVIDTNGQKCSCGNQGCLDAISSGFAIEKEYKQKTKKNKSFEEIMSLTKKEKTAKQAMQNAGSAFGIGLANTVNILTPDIVVIAGQLTSSKEYVDAALKEMQKNTRILSRKIQVLKSATEDAGILGASSIVM